MLEVAHHLPAPERAALSGSVIAESRGSVSSTIWLNRAEVWAVQGRI
jgi:hypothetical protein